MFNCSLAQRCSHYVVIDTSFKQILLLLTGEYGSSYIFLHELKRVGEWGILSKNSLARV